MSIWLILALVLLALVFGLAVFLAISNFRAACLREELDGTFRVIESRGVYWPQVYAHYNIRWGWYYLHETTTIRLSPTATVHMEDRARYVRLWGYGVDGALSAASAEEAAQHIRDFMHSHPERYGRCLEVLVKEDEAVPIN